MTKSPVAPDANMRTPIRRRFAAIPALFALPLLPVAAAAAPQESNDPAPAEAADEEPAPEPLPARPPDDVEGTLPEEWANAHTWRSIGPANMGGRCTDIAVNPLDANEYWVATATGGSSTRSTVGSPTSISSRTSACPPSERSPSRRPTRA